MKKIAAITMVRNDVFFLHKWINYYGNKLGKKNLFIYFDGLDQKIPDFCEGTNYKKVEKIGTSVVSSDKGRIKFISQKATELFNSGYDLVIGGDADEYLVVDPYINVSLVDFLSNLKIRTCASGLGLDFGQLIGREKELSLDLPFLNQRHFAQIGTRYTKVSILSEPVKWGSGFHRVKGKNFHIINDLYLMHFGYSDLQIIENRLNDEDRINQGWSHHMNKRKRVIKFVNFLPIRKFEPMVKLTRRIEQIVRPPYAWNKPGLLGLRIIVEIPQRFYNIL